MTGLDMTLGELKAIERRVYKDSGYESEDVAELQAGYRLADEDRAALLAEVERLMECA